MAVIVQNFFFCFAVLELELRTFSLSHFTSHIFVVGVFEIGSHKLVAQGWLGTVILLISAS
jgi:hypothetical protein